MDGFYYDDRYIPDGYGYPGEYEGYYPEDYLVDARLQQFPDYQRRVYGLPYPRRRNGPGSFEELYDDGTHPGSGRMADGWELEYRSHYRHQPMKHYY